MSSPKAIGSRSFSAFLWGSTGSLAKLILQTGTQIVLARLLGPEQYGLFAIAAIVISFSNFFSDVGIAYGLIQRNEVTSSHVRYVFTWQLITGTFVTVLIVAGARALAEFFNEPRAESLIATLALVCVLQSAAAVSTNLLKRDLDFKSIQIAQTVAYFIGYLLVGLPMAIGGFKVWSLVIAWLTTSAVSLVLLYRRTRHPLRPLLSHPDSNEISRFGLTVLLTNLVNWVVGNIDRVLVARIMSSTAVGFYTSAYNLIYMPSATLMGVIQPVMYSACSKVEGDSDRIARAYLTLVAAITLAVLPMFVALGVVADTFVLALYGTAWLPSARVLQPLAFAMPMFMLWNITTPPIWASGRPGLEFKMQVPIAITWLICSAVAVHYSLDVVAWTVFALFVARTALFVLVSMRVVRISLADYLDAVRGGVLLSIAVGFVAWTVDTFLQQYVPNSAGLRLILIIASCLAAALAAIRISPRLVHSLLADVMAREVTRLPNTLQRKVRRLLNTGTKEEHVR